MSDFIDQAGTIKTRLEAQASLSSVPILVDAQKDLTKEILQATSRASQSIIIIKWTGSTAGDEDQHGLVQISSYDIRVITCPVLRADATTADNHVETIIQALGGWLPTDDPLCRRRFRVGAVVEENIEFNTTPFLVYRVSVTNQIEFEPID